MSEYVTGLLVIFSEVALLLAIVVGIIVYFFVRRGKRDKVMAKVLVETIKKKETQRFEHLRDILEKVHNLDEASAKQNVESILACEKKLYARIIKMFLGHDRGGIAKINSDVESLSDSYRRLSDVAELVEVEKHHSDDNPLVQTQLKSQVKKLEKENAKLERDLNEAMESMDSMLKEYTLMYSGGGGKHDGVKHLENELSQLKQKIAKSHVDALDDENDSNTSNTDDGSDIPDLGMDAVVPPTEGTEGKEVS